MKNQKKIWMGIVLLCAVMAWAGPAPAAQFLTSQIYDVNKYSRSGVAIPIGVDPNDSSDSEMCWAAAAANVLTYTGWAIDLDTDGTQEIYDDVYHGFLADFPNQGGGGGMAYQHYLEHYWAAEMAGAGTTWNDYFHTDTEDATILETIDTYLNQDYGVYLSITNDAGTLGHAITCWGFETDDNGDYTRIAVTDSDRGTGIGETHLQWWDVTFDGTAWYLDDYGTDVYIRRIDAFEQNGFASTVPEPGMLVLVGTGLFVLLGRRRIR